MPSLTGFLAERLKLKVNRDKSAVARPWHGSSWATASPGNGRQGCAWPSRAADAQGEGQGTVAWGQGRTSAPRIRPSTRSAWVDTVFPLTEPKRALEELDRWIRHKLRASCGGNGNGPIPCAQDDAAGLDGGTGVPFGVNHRGPWWNAGASPHERAFPTTASITWGSCRCLIRARLQRLHEPPYTEPYVRWCGRTAGVTPPPTRCDDARGFSRNLATTTISCGLRIWGGPARCFLTERDGTAPSAPMRDGESQRARLCIAPGLYGSDATGSLPRGCRYSRVGRSSSPSAEPGSSALPMSFDRRFSR